MRARSRSTEIVLLTLVGLDVLWTAVSDAADPGSFAALYALAWGLGARAGRRLPVVVMGVLGFALHVHEIAAGRTVRYDAVDGFFLVANLTLPVLLLACVAVASRPRRGRPTPAAG